MTTTRSIAHYRLSRALYEARCIDVAGVSLESADLTYRVALTGGTRSTDQLNDAESFPIAAGLLTSDGVHVMPSEALTVLCRLRDDHALQALIGALGLAEALPADNKSSIISEEERAALERAGEEYVVSRCREELVNLGYGHLAVQVQQVSIVTDSLGNDVIAPLISDGVRLLEVKTQRSPADHAVRFFVTRNEYDVGRRNQSWAIVICDVSQEPNGDIELIGWCRAATLAPYLPVDGNGRWTEALVHLPRSLLYSGAPEAI